MQSGERRCVVDLSEFVVEWSLSEAFVLCYVVVNLGDEFDSRVESLQHLESREQLAVGDKLDARTQLKQDEVDEGESVADQELVARLRQVLDNGFHPNDQLLTQLLLVHFLLVARQVGLPRQLSEDVSQHLNLGEVGFGLA